VGKNVKIAVALSLMVIILFSTIGLNLITSLCIGCHSEHTFVVLSAPEQTSCFCCDHEAEATSCCDNHNSCSNEHHHTKSQFAQLKINTPEHGNKTTQALIVLIVLLLGPNYSASENTVQNNFIFCDHSGPPKSGRALLAMNCVLRN
jgi:hypothetical protein